MTALNSCVFLSNYKPTLFSLSCKTFRTLLYDHPISNGVVEGINNKIKVLKRIAYGYRDVDYFQLRLYALHDQVITQNLG